MGAWFKFYERRMERQLRQEVPRGVPEAPPLDYYGAALWTQEGSAAARDLRRLIPPLGLKEYWYPALPAGRVAKKPLLWVMLGKELVLFRDADGEVVALSDICPHRGASLSRGACYYKGHITCPYHGATFDRDGACKAWLTEGPDSRMPGHIHATPFPTRTLRGWVFVWMGKGEPAPIEQDVPPEFFEPESTLIIGGYTYWKTNWMLALENQLDSHNCAFAHRNAVCEIFGKEGRPRTPFGPRTKTVNERAVVVTDPRANDYFTDGRIPYQMNYPGINGVWPLRRTRLLWKWFFR